jgi:tripartite-type tricarboxylate transporter receptor subunit TctC
MKTILKPLVLAAAAALALAALAGDFPAKDKPVSIFVPFAAGGPTD